MEETSITPLPALYSRHQRQPAAEAAVLDNVLAETLNAGGGSTEVRGTHCTHENGQVSCRTPDAR